MTCYRLSQKAKGATQTALIYSQQHRSPPFRTRREKEGGFLQRFVKVRGKKGQILGRDE
jgi:hypothetical protein